VAGRIRDADVVTVRERSRIEDVVGEYVTLRNAGGGNLKALCPFHEEKTPSFSVSPPKGFWYCFSCAEGGDVIRFVEKIEQMTFLEAVERLAERAGVQLTYEQAGPAPVRQQGVKQRLVAAHQEAARFYADQLASPDAKVGREFLAERGFDKAAAEQFGVGFAPTAWDLLVKHLRAKGFANKELVDAGLAKAARSGSLIDRFHGRLLWPIRDLGGDVVGFGARKLLDSDDGPKYLNTPETPIYRKGHLLYGLDLAKREIARRHQAVVVEGYTDVMACHLAGVPTAIATCGTAFGADHIQVLRRLIFDRTEDDAAEIIFTFDGDAAGQKAALRAFEEDQRFLMQTFVAIERSGADPCELRQAKGDTAVRDLVARREPLVAFALRTMIGRYDVSTPEGQVQALRRAAPLVARIKDHQLRTRYATRLGIECGVDERTAREAVHRAIQGERAAAPAKRAVADRPDPADPNPALFAQREALKLALQHPVLAGPLFDAIDTAPYTHPAYAAVRQALVALGGVASQTGGVEYLDAARGHCPDLVSQALVAELSVEPLRLDHEPDADYVRLILARLQVPAVAAEVAALKAKLQRMNPVEEPEPYTKLVGELFALEQHLRGLRDQALGS
jgi:DNA primase